MADVGDEVKDTADGNRKLTPNVVYFHRLIGDNPYEKKAAKTRPSDLKSVFRFLAYTILATYVIYRRAEVNKLFMMNNSVNAILTTEPYRMVNGRNLYFDDIQYPEDIIDWLYTSIMQPVMTTGPGYENFTNSILIYNRMIPVKSVCISNAAITMTVRKVKLSTDTSWTTTARFGSLYPNAWVVPTIGPGSDEYSKEEKGTMRLRSDLLNVPEWDFDNEWVHTPHGSDRGYSSTGGYIAVLIMQPGAPDALVHLYDRSSSMTAANYDQGICDTDLPRSATMPAGQFFSALGTQLEEVGSIAMEFAFYNANLQLISLVEASFTIRNTGMITRKHLKSETINMEIYIETMKYFEVAYLIFTVCYFLEFCYRAFKNGPSKTFKDVFEWIDLISAFSSFSSLVVMYAYIPILTDFKKTDDFLSTDKLREQFGWLRTYLRFASFATLVVYFKLIKFLSVSVVRVQLLVRAIGLSFRRMALFYAYIIAVFLGFWAFGYTQFSSFSENFTTVFDAFLSLQFAFFGDTFAKDGFENPFKGIFFVLFMQVFFVVSVQMFNAIINYQYNMVSEEMQSELNPETDRSEDDNKKSKFEIYAKGCKSLCQNLFHRGSQKKPAESQAEEAEEEAEGDEHDEQEKDDDEKKAAAGDAPAYSQLDIQLKQKVEALLGKTDKKPPDGPVAIMMFVVFVACYIWFLSVNLAITENLSMATALDSTIKGTPVVRVETYNETVPQVGANATNGSVPTETVTQTDYVYYGWSDVNRPMIAKEWLGSALRSILFNSSSPSTGPSNGICIMNWNCLVQGTVPGLAATGPKLIRLTQQRKRFGPNTGGSIDSPPDQRFQGGRPILQGGAVDTTQFSAQVMTPLQSDWTEFEDDFTQFLGQPQTPEVGARTFCGQETIDRVPTLVCYLDADLATFDQQMQILMDDNFVAGGTSQVMLDFAAYNGNLNMIAYVQINFDVRPTGVVQKTLDTNSMKLFDMDRIQENFLGVFARILPGIIYQILVCVFANKLRNDWRAECFRKNVNYNTNRQQATIEFFTQDIYNPLELISISISCVSGVMFIYWLVTEGNKWKFADDYGNFLDYMRSLAQVARNYNRISAVNMLMIFVRPLKYVRENPRMAQFYKTLWDSKNDTIWFVVILAITMFGFSMFAYVSFGTYFVKCSKLTSVFAFCFSFLFGQFELTPLNQADELMAWIFFWPYLITCYLIYTNIFFAIIDRFFISGDTPPVNYKRKLKPFLHRICRCIEWDEEFQMDADPNGPKKKIVKSRKEKAAILSQKLQELVKRGQDDTYQASSKRSKLLQEVCDPAEFDKDAKMANVKNWSTEEARKLVSKFRKLHKDKESSRDSEQFIRNTVMKRVEKEKRKAEKEMKQMQRRKVYEIEVKEELARQDQVTLAKYIVYLEESIRKQMAEKYALEQEVKALVVECQHMQDANEEEEEGAGEEEEEDDQLLGIEDGGEPFALTTGAPASPNGDSGDLPTNRSSNADSSADQPLLAALPGSDTGQQALEDDKASSHDGGSGSNKGSTGQKDSRRNKQLEAGSTRRSALNNRQQERREAKSNQSEKMRRALQDSLETG